MLKFSRSKEAKEPLNVPNDSVMPLKKQTASQMICSKALAKGKTSMVLPLETAQKPTRVRIQLLVSVVQPSRVEKASCPQEIIQRIIPVSFQTVAFI